MNLPDAPSREQPDLRDDPLRGPDGAVLGRELLQHGRVDPVDDSAGHQIRDVAAPEARRISIEMRWRLGELVAARLASDQSGRECRLVRNHPALRWTSAGLRGGIGSAYK